MKVPEAEYAATDLHFPVAGVDVSAPVWRQPARNVGGRYARSAPAGRNVRSYEPAGLRNRGGSRPGLVRYLDARPGDRRWITQELTNLVGTGYDPPGGGVPQTSFSGRVVTLVAVSRGEVYVVNPGDTAWTAATNSTGETPPLNITGLVRSTQHSQKLWFVDGVNYAYYDPFLNTLYPWVASAGELPYDDEDNAARLVCTWRGRVVLSGLLLDPQNWFMTRIGDPTDLDYEPAEVSADMPIAGNNAPQGLIGDVITSLCPYSDDVLIFFGDHSIYLMRGDPLAGGQLDLVTDVIGGVFGVCWCRDPFGAVYFLSNRLGVYSMIPGQAPVRISKAIEKELEAINTGTHGCRLLWDDRLQGFHLFVTKLAEAAPATHWFYEARTGGWFPDVFGDDDFNPLACCTFDGNEPGDRVALIGSWDGYVRALSPDAEDDDGEPIESSVTIGPFTTPTLDEITLHSLQAVLGEASGEVTWEVFVGATAEAALASEAVRSGTWEGGRNLTSAVAKSGHAVYVRLSSTNRWALEQIRAVTSVRGLRRQRGR